MPTLNHVYELIEKAEVQIKENNIIESTKFYKQAIQDINLILKELKKDDVNDEIVESVEILKKDISQTIFDLNAFIEEQRLTSKGTTIKNSANINMGSMFLSMKPSMNNMNRTNYWDFNNNIDGDSLVNNPILNGILNKLQNNLVNLSKEEFQTGKTVTSKQQEEFESELNQNLEQFKKEVGWYEQRMFSEFDTKISKLQKENKKLQHQVEKLDERWNNLVESARQKRGL